ncbi:MAG: asparagine synthase (glutamine-hydrolyzing) [Bacteroidota bacterium]|nr:asparagine synthase (glutamine-hydrolyzing) [Bacteroidota bacterium]
MCGIAGILMREYGRQADAAVCKRMLECLRHRGPDDEGSWRKDNVFLGHTRLSIIDTTENGRQPFLSERGDIVAVFNGEIYNSEELKADLVRRGHRFIGASDGEVIPHLYEEYGESLAEKLRGMFAIAIYDMPARRLFLMRDRFGIKPLYYASAPEGFAFASEIKALFPVPFLDFAIDYQSVSDYLNLSYIPDPATGFVHVSALTAGTVLKWEEGKTALRVYWSYRAGNDGEIPRAEDLRELLRQAVGRQLRADVPIGTMLSGGIDSSIVTTFAASETERNIASYTVKFAESAYDESEYARAVATAVGAKHTIVEIGKDCSSIEELEGILTHFDQPFGDSSSIPTYYISREMRKHVKAALSGDGGDEIFYGYPDFTYISAVLLARPFIGMLHPRTASAAAAVIRSRPQIARYIRRLQAYRGKSPDAILADMYSYLSDEEKKHALSPEGQSAFSGAESTLRLYAPYAERLAKEPKDAVSEFLVKYSLPCDMLKKVDMMSMASGLEVRVPLLDEQVVDFASRLPAREKHRRGRGKIPLREILKPHIPSAAIERRKQGFGIPFDTFLKGEHRRYIANALLDVGSPAGRLFKRDWLELLLDAFLYGNKRPDLRSRYMVYQLVYMLFSLDRWLRRHA